ncbi:MAG: D-alanyl-D-alanine carboxypeptidase family protein [Kiloniellales bacterium]
MTFAGQAEARYASIVVDYESGRVLHETNADTRNYPASLVKMMTLYLAFEAVESGELKMTQQIKVSRRAAGMPASKLGLKRGQKISVKNLIMALVTKSANDAAVVLAEAMSGKEIRFALRMNKKARELGMKRTSFRNASGLPNRRQMSTARDIAKLARALIRDFPEFYKLFSAKEFVYKGRRYRNHNRLLRKYKGADGIKTGYIRASGFNLVLSAVRDGRRIIAVVFGGKTPRSRDRHIVRLMDRGFVRMASLGDEKIPGPPQRKPARTLVAEANDLKDSSGLKHVAAPMAVRTRKNAERVEVGSGEKPSLERIFGVQVGAYYGYRRAKRVAQQTINLYPDLLGKTRIVVTHIKGQRGKIYRARLVGLTEPSARKTCKRLHAAKADCLVVQTRRTTAQTGRARRVAQN